VTDLFPHYEFDDPGLQLKAILQSLRTTPAKKLVRGPETAVLANVPGYELLKRMGESMLGVEKQTGHQMVLARTEDAWQIAFLVERLEGGHVAVLVPGAPNLLSGSVYFMTQDRIKAVDIPAAGAIKCLRRVGAGSNALLRGLHLPPATDH
jgi:uncharacterized membrane protein